MQMPKASVGDQLFGSIQGVNMAAYGYSKKRFIYTQDICSCLACFCLKNKFYRNLRLAVARQLPIKCTEHSKATN